MSKDKEEHVSQRHPGIYERFIKRPLDCFLASIALLVLSPVFLVIALLARTKLGSPILFKQERPGLNGKIFVLYKFRSMTNETDENGNPLPDEVRLTKFGKFLRSTSLDELPQLINIIRGDMAIVGPRALLVSYLPYYSEEEQHRHDVRPGLTNLVSVKGRNTVSIKDKFEYDVYYVNHLSFRLDVCIILRTIIVVLKHQGTNLENNKYMEYFIAEGRVKTEP